MFQNPLEERGGKGLQRAQYVFLKKKVLSTHYVPTTCARTMPAHRLYIVAGPTSGRKCYITPAFSGIPNKGDQIKAKKNKKKQKQKFSHGIPDPAYSPAD